MNTDLTLILICGLPVLGVFIILSAIFVYCALVNLSDADDEQEGR